MSLCLVLFCLFPSNVLHSLNPLLIDCHPFFRLMRTKLSGSLAKQHSTWRKWNTIGWKSLWRHHSGGKAATAIMFSAPWLVIRSRKPCFYLQEAWRHAGLKSSVSFKVMQSSISTQASPPHHNLEFRSWSVIVGLSSILLFVDGNLEALPDITYFDVNLEALQELMHSGKNLEVLPDLMHSDKNLEALPDLLYSVYRCV